jgi:hypothetical protein
MSAATELRPILCPSCRRFLGEIDHPLGRLRIYCKACQAWVIVRLDEPAPSLPPERLEQIRRDRT